MGELPGMGELQGARCKTALLPTLAPREEVNTTFQVACVSLNEHVLFLLLQFTDYAVARNRSRMDVVR